MAKILAVDDEQDLLVQLQAIAEQDDHEFVSASSGREATEAFKREKPDLVLLDLMLSDISGMRVCQSIRSISAVPIIILSALRDKKRIVEAYERGADDYISKPFDAEELQAKIRVHLERTNAPHKTAEGLADNQRHFGGFVLQKLIGHGSVGTVYSAHPEGRPERQVAVKCLAPELTRNQKYVTRFLREAEYTRDVDDPHIITILEAGHYHGTYYYVMELVVGISLYEYVTTTEERDLMKILLVIGDIMNALCAVHEAGFIHRDVSAKNILLDEKDGIAKLADFGIAKRSQAEESTTTSVIVGTPHYLAPEVIEGRDADIRSDLYSLGICLYLGAVGRFPYKGDKMQLMYQHTTKPIIVPDDVPDDVTELIHLLTNRAPEGRPNHPGIAQMALVNVIENHIRLRRQQNRS